MFSKVVNNKGGLVKVSRSAVESVIEACLEIDGIHKRKSKQ